MKKIGDIDYDLKLPKKTLYLCKPNKQTIAIINEAYDIQYNTKIGTINELSFKIPIVIIKDDVLMENPNVSRIKHRFLFKLVINKKVEYFLFNEQNKSYGGDEYIEYQAYSLGSQLSDKHIRDLSFIGDLKQVGESILDSIYGDLKTVPIKRWEIGIVDQYFLESNSEKSLSVREVDITSVSALEAIYQIAETWNALIEWDTVDLKINFYRPENYGLNKGFYIRDGKYLESFDLNINSTDVVSRLRVFGSDGLDFREISPLGEDYIEDYSYYMYPFEYDKESKKVIKSSDLMSDELCIAIMTYQDYLESQGDRYNEIIQSVRLADEILNAESQKLSSIVSQRVLIEMELDRLLSEFQKDKDFWGTNGFNEFGNKMNTPEHHSILTKLAAKKLEESTQEIAVKNAELEVADANDKKLKYLEDVSPTNFFSIKEWEEFQNFIVTKEYSNDAITNMEDLLEEAHTVFEQYKQPKLTISVNVVDFLSIVECQNDWDKLNLGDTIRIKYDRMKVNIIARIVEINYDLQNFEIEIVISNEKEASDDDAVILSTLNAADITSSIVQLDKNKWNLGKEANGKVNDIINNKWDSWKNAILAGGEQLVEISERGIIVKSPEDPDSWLVINNGMIAITNDRGNTWKHGISKDGIFGEQVFGKLISGVNLYIEDESGAWKTQGSRTTIYNNAGDEVMWLGLISDNSRDKYDNILRGEDECFGLLSWNSQTQVEISECKGFVISKWDNKYSENGEYQWEKTLWANTDGTLYARDLVAQSLKIVNDIGETILDAENAVFDIGFFDEIVTDGKLTALEKLQIARELYELHSDYKELLIHANDFVRSNRDNTVDFTKAWDSENGFTVKKSEIDLYITTPLVNAYTNLITYISEYITVISKGISSTESLNIDMNTQLMKESSVITDRGEFIQKFKDYHEESLRLKKEIENAIFYSGINMGEYYNNIMIDKHGFVAVRNDGQYRAYLNATNGLALEKWEGNRWVKKLYASLGDSEYSDGTLIAEDLVARRLRIETKFNEVLLDVDSLNIDFGVLNSIVYDDIIASIEKETLKSQWESIIAQYVQLNYELDKYITEVYDDREETYYALDLAQTAMIKAKENLLVHYDALRVVLEIVFTNMTTHTHIEADLKMNRIQFVDLFNKLYAAFEIARNSLKDFLEKSSLQLGRNYNNTIIDAENGVTVYRGDMLHRTQMNATKGFSLSRNEGTYDNPKWVDLFWVDTEGWLFAKGLRANNLMVFGGQHEDLILDANTGMLDFTLLNDIVYDDVIISSEKSTLFSMLAQATAQYNQIISQHNVFRNNKYESEHELEPTEVTRMKSVIDTAKEKLNLSHSNLSSVMATVLHDVNKTTRISTDLARHGISDRDGFKKVWENFYSNYDELRNALENYLGASSLQLGRNYNNVVIDENGVTIYGISTVEGGEVNSTLQMNATVGISLTVEGENRLWLGVDGLIYAKKLRIMGDDEDSIIEDIDGSYISDLTVNSLKTLGRENTKQDIIHISKNFMRFNTWYEDTEKTKLEFTYEGSGDDSYPVMIYGAGNGKNYGNGSEKAKIYKDGTRFAIEYDSPYAEGQMTKFYFNESDTNNEGQAVYFESQGGIRFHSDNRFVAKTNETQYLSIVKDTFLKLQFGAETFIEVTDGQIRLRVNGDNHLTITNYGILVNGTYLDVDKLNNL